MLRSFALLSLLLVACGGPPTIRPPLRVASAELVAIEPDVHTVADVDQPVFFSHGSYWLFHDGKWWRGQTLTGTWQLARKPPVPIRQIQQPFAYTHYRHDHPVADATARPPEQTASRPTLPRDPSKPSRDTTMFPR